ncbi:MAG: alkaline phosphatase [Puniceicoccaceae bacterium 5H]|nr:MAG: alkaline phosphatase [Puniceicoccaceae bacterium 5H]
MSKTHKFSRRHFLQATGLGSLLLGASRLGAAPAITSGRAKAKNLIFLVVDGMTNGTLAATNTWLNKTQDRDSQWMHLYSDAVARRSLMETHSASSIVTDSAAASSSWGGGKRIPNRRINVDADGKELTPLYTYGRQAGKKLGLVTTARITHATPAGFATNVIHRDMEDDIAEQYLQREVDVLLGGGSRHFDPAKRKDGKDVFAQARKQDYTVVRTRDELAQTRKAKGKLLGTFSNSHVPYMIDRLHDSEIDRVTPSLEEMMTVALDRLKGSKEGFLLQVEAGRVDHAAHNNDPAAILPEQMEFDRCIALGRRFAEENEDTLVIVTTDHGTGGFVVNGYGHDYNLSTPMFMRLGKTRHSYEYLADNAPKDATPGELRRQLVENWGMEPSDQLQDQMEQAFRAWQGDPQLLGIYLRNPLYDYYAVNWTTHNHTGDLVELATWGPGSEAIPAYLENWQLHHVIRDVMAL